MVIAIIGTLVALLLPAVQSARESGRRSAVHEQPQADRLGPAHLPRGLRKPALCRGRLLRRYAGHTGDLWTTAIFPDLDQNALYDQIDHTQYTQNWPLSILTPVIPTYICPSDPDSQHPVYTNRYAHDNPPTALGLWYTGSMGPTIPDYCPYCPDPNPSPTNWCCQGLQLGNRLGE